MFSAEEIDTALKSVPVWFHQIEVAPGVTTPGLDFTAVKLQQLGLVDDMQGMRVLDIGTWDGAFAFACETRGAEVVAIDGRLSRGFVVAHYLLDSHVTFREMNIYDLSPALLGRFDLVLCLGVLYHLRHPLLGLDRIHDVCVDDGELVVECQICDSCLIDSKGVERELASFGSELSSVPLVQFYPGSELNGDATNWWSPNMAALAGWIRSAGFEVQSAITPNGIRAFVHALRRYRPPNREWTP